MLNSRILNIFKFVELPLLGIKPVFFFLLFSLFDHHHLCNVRALASSSHQPSNMKHKKDRHFTNSFQTGIIVRPCFFFFFVLSKIYHNYKVNKFTKVLFLGTNVFSWHKFTIKNHPKEVGLYDVCKVTCVQALMRVKAC